MKKTLKNERECIEENSRKYNRTLANRKNNLKETKKSEVRLKSLNTWEMVKKCEYNAFERQPCKDLKYGKSLNFTL